jgi:hypothetical protein
LDSQLDQPPAQLNSAVQPMTDRLSVAAREVMHASVEQLVPQPGAYFTWLSSPSVRRRGLDASEQIVCCNDFVWMTASTAYSYVREPRPQAWAVGIGSVLLVVVAAGLMCFRAVAVFGASCDVGCYLCKPDPWTWHNVVRPLIVSVRLGYRHFGTVIAHTGLIWVVCTTFQLLCVIAPQALLRSWWMHALPRSGADPWLIAVSGLALTLSAEVLNALLAGLSCVYYARLYRALSAWPNFVKSDSRPMKRVSRAG